MTNHINNVGKAFLSKLWLWLALGWFSHNTFFFLNFFVYRFILSNSKYYNNRVWLTTIKISKILVD